MLHPPLSSPPQTAETTISAITASTISSKLSFSNTALTTPDLGSPKKQKATLEPLLQVVERPEEESSRAGTPSDGGSVRSAGYDQKSQSSESRGLGISGGRKVKDVASRFEQMRSGHTPSPTPHERRPLTGPRRLPTRPASPLVTLSEPYKKKEMSSPLHSSSPVRPPIHRTNESKMRKESPHSGQRRTPLSVHTDSNRMDSVSSMPEPSPLSPASTLRPPTYRTDDSGMARENVHLGSRRMPLSIHTEPTKVLSSSSMASTRPIASASTSRATENFPIAPSRRLPIPASFFDAPPTRNNPDHAPKETPTRLNRERGSTKKMIQKWETQTTISPTQAESLQNAQGLFTRDYLDKKPLPSPHANSPINTPPKVPPSFTPSKSIRDPPPPLADDLSTSPSWLRTPIRSTNKHGDSLAVSPSRSHYSLSESPTGKKQKVSPLRAVSNFLGKKKGKGKEKETRRDYGDIGAIGEGEGRFGLVPQRDRMGSAEMRRSADFKPTIRSNPVIWLIETPYTPSLPWGDWLPSWAHLTSDTLSVTYCPVFSTPRNAHSGTASRISSNKSSTKSVPFSAITPPPLDTPADKVLHVMNCLDIKSLKKDDLKARGVPLAPDGNGGEVLEIVWENEVRSYLAVEGVDGRNAWLAAIRGIIPRTPVLPPITPAETPFATMSSPLRQASLPRMPSHRPSVGTLHGGETGFGSLQLVENEWVASRPLSGPLSGYGSSEDGSPRRPLPVPGPVKEDSPLRNSITRMFSERKFDTREKEQAKLEDVFGVDETPMDIPKPFSNEKQRSSSHSSEVSQRIIDWQTPVQTERDLSVFARSRLPPIPTTEPFYPHKDEEDSGEHLNIPPSETMLSFDSDDLNPSRSASQVGRADTVIDGDGDEAEQKREKANGDVESRAAMWESQTTEKDSSYISRVAFPKPNFDSPSSKAKVYTVGLVEHDMPTPPFSGKGGENDMAGAGASPSRTMQLALQDLPPARPISEFMTKPLDIHKKGPADSSTDTLVNTPGSPQTIVLGNLPPPADVSRVNTPSSSSRGSSMDSPITIVPLEKNIVHQTMNVPRRGPRPISTSTFGRRVSSGGKPSPHSADQQTTPPARVVTPAMVAQPSTSRDLAMGAVSSPSPASASDSLPSRGKSRKSLLNFPVPGLRSSSPSSLASEGSVVAPKSVGSERFGASVADLIRRGDTPSTPSPLSRPSSAKPASAISRPSSTLSRQGSGIKGQAGPVKVLTALFEPATLSDAPVVNSRPSSRSSGYVKKDLATTETEVPKVVPTAEDQYTARDERQEKPIGSTSLPGRIPHGILRPATTVPVLLGADPGKGAFVTADLDQVPPLPTKDVSSPTSELVLAQMQVLTDRTREMSDPETAPYPTALQEKLSALHQDLDLVKGLVTPAPETTVVEGVHLEDKDVEHNASAMDLSRVYTHLENLEGRTSTLLDPETAPYPRALEARLDGLYEELAAVRRLIEEERLQQPQAVYLTDAPLQSRHMPGGNLPYAGAAFSAHPDTQRGYDEGTATVAKHDVPVPSQLENDVPGEGEAAKFYKSLPEPPMEEHSSKAINNTPARHSHASGAFNIPRRAVPSSAPTPKAATQAQNIPNTPAAVAPASPAASAHDATVLLPAAKVTEPADVKDMTVSTGGDLQAEDSDAIMAGDVPAPPHRILNVTNRPRQRGPPPDFRPRPATLNMPAPLARQFTVREPSVDGQHLEPDVTARSVMTRDILTPTASHPPTIAEQNDEVNGRPGSAATIAMPVPYSPRPVTPPDMSEIHKKLDALTALYTQFVGTQKGASVPATAAPSDETRKVETNPVDQGVTGAMDNDEKPGLEARDVRDKPSLPRLSTVMRKAVETPVADKPKEISSKKDKPDAKAVEGETPKAEPLAKELGDAKTSGDKDVPTTTAGGANVRESEPKAVEHDEAAAAEEVAKIMGNEDGENKILKQQDVHIISTTPPAKDSAADPPTSIAPAIPEETLKQMDEAMDMLKGLNEAKDSQKIQAADMGKYLGELNAWLEKFVTGSSGHLQQMSGRLDTLFGPEPDQAGDAPTGLPALIADMHKMLVDQQGRNEAEGYMGQRLDSLVSMMGHDQERQAVQEAATGQILHVLEKQRQDHEILLRAIATDLTEEIRGEKMKFLESMQKATTVNVMMHIEEFKRLLNVEVNKSMGELGKVREEKRALEQQIADLFALKAKHGFEPRGLPATPAAKSDKAAAKPPPPPPNHP
ncbi:hypothetical protein L202_01699 [Cryptococcus amylolentus CBS 6039]|uniref:PH domain-containing protein n=1 Tax=Cryptococcus amylolentus CBS 6039 TaxID=1295533 RepID=A0A1E3I517_9TREE|nr:hypothetical protein L202_01699 [Cryptococcus amylolentus CBS 6039]ODN83587.1 hypothetical protein L202_01699 [Cryptococcus amylolentus CBS 6039]